MSKKRILIAEDEKFISKALELKLQNSGYEAKAVYNRHEALDILEKEKVDLVFLDIIMSKKDGFAVFAELKARKSKIPVIISSNREQNEDVKKAKALGAKDFFIKANTPLTDVIGYTEKQLK